MSFGKSFLSMLNTTDSTALDKQVFSGGKSQLKFLEDGEHDLRVASVDRTKLGDNKLMVKYEDAQGLEYNDYIFLEDTNKKTGKTQLNWKFANTLGMLLPDPEAVQALFAEFTADRPQALDLLIGLRGRIVLKKLKGYGSPEHCDQAGIKFFVVKDGQTGLVAGSGNTIDEATSAAQTAGYDKAFPKADQYIATHAEEHIAKFTQALASLGQPSASKSAFAGITIAS